MAQTQKAIEKKDSKTSTNRGLPQKGPLRCNLLANKESNLMFFSKQNVEVNGVDTLPLQVSL